MFSILFLKISPPLSPYTQFSSPFIIKVELPKIIVYLKCSTTLFCFVSVTFVLFNFFSVFSSIAKDLIHSLTILCIFYLIYSYTCRKCYHSIHVIICIWQVHHRSVLVKAWSYCHRKLVEPLECGA